MARNAAALPWRQATQLRDDLRTGELSLSMSPPTCPPAAS